MKRQEIIKQHPYSIWFNENSNRWCTRFYDETKMDKSRLVTRNKREDLENAIVEEYYKIHPNAKAGNTARAIYPDWMKLKVKRTTDANGCKLQWVWNKYYENSPIADIPLETMDAATLEEWFLDVIKENHLTRRQFMEVKAVINMIFDHAIKKNVVSTNIARNIRGFEYKLFAQTKKKSVCEQIYVHDDKEQIMRAAMSQFEKTGNTAYVAVILNFYLDLQDTRISQLHRRVTSFQPLRLRTIQTLLRKFLALDSGCNQKDSKCNHIT